MKICRSVVLVSLVFIIACTAPVQPPIEVQRPALISPIINHQQASGCRGEHDTIFLPGAYIDAYPSLPPRAEPDHIVLHLSDGTTIWSKPEYGTSECTGYMTCRRAVLLLNPAWNACTPHGILYEMTSVDGRLLLESNAWQMTDLKTKATTFVGFSCGEGIAGSDLGAVSRQSQGSACSPEAPVSGPTGAKLAAAMNLGTAYFNYRASYDRGVQCVADETSSNSWTTRCY
jgi:hypothetical protein